MQIGYSDAEQLYLSLSNSVLCGEPFLYHSVAVYICVFMYVCLYVYTYVEKKEIAMETPQRSLPLLHSVLCVDTLDQRVFVDILYAR